MAIPGLLACLALRYDASRVVDLRARGFAVATALQDALSSMDVSRGGGGGHREGTGRGRHQTSVAVACGHAARTVCRTCLACKPVSAGWGRLNNLLCLLPLPQKSHIHAWRRGQWL